MACPARGGNWKARLLAICESEWFGECCVGRRGRSRVTASQTASRGELLTPPRSQKAPGMTPQSQGFKLEEGRLEVNINMHFYEFWHRGRVREKKNMRK